MDVKKEQLSSDRTMVMHAESQHRLIMPLANTEANLLCTSANAYMTSCRVQNGEVRVEGMLRGCASLECDDFDSVYGQTEFSESMPLEEGASATAAISIQKCVGRKEGSSAVLEIQLGIDFICILPQEITVITALEGEDMQVAAAEVESSKFGGIYNQRSTINENIELSVRMPQIKQCLQAMPCAVIEETRVQDGEVLLSGDLVLNVLYACGDEYEPITQVADKIPFSVVIDAPNAMEDDEIFLFVAIEDGNVMPQDNEQGEKRILACDIGINCIVVIMKKQKSRVVLNAYSTEHCVQREYVDAMLSECVCDRKQQSVRLTVDKPGDMPAMARICAVTAYPWVSSVRCFEGGANLICCAQLQVMYIVSGTGEIACFDCVKEFEINLDCPIGQKSMLSAFLSTELLQAALLSSSKCELRMVLGIDVIGNTQSKVRMLSDVTLAQKREPGCGICVYIIQDGDTLFTVGEQLGVSIEELRTLNPDLSDNPREGERITVFRRLRVS